jgi:hypothetical protein
MSKRIAACAKERREVVMLPFGGENYEAKKCSRARVGGSLT